MSDSDSDPKNSDPEMQQPPDEQPGLPPNGNGDGDPHPRPVRITSVSPIAGGLAGGIDVTITGTGFQLGAEFFFGGNQSPQVTFVSSTRVTAKLPPAAQIGTVAVTVVNPDDTTATKPGAFTYVTTEASLHAEVLGVDPLTVIEDTESEITLRGRNLIAAYNSGIIALRGSTRVNITFSSASSSTDPETGIESLVLTVRITATPPLEQHERKAIQVLASLRPGAGTDGVFESSRQMFTVLPRAVPVALGFTANLDPTRPSLVLVAGRNLEGCSLDLGPGAMVHYQKSDDQTVAAIVSFAEGASAAASAQLRLLDAAGGEAGQFAMTVAPSTDSSAPNSSSENIASDPAEPGSAMTLVLAPVPGQKILGPTATDSAIFHARGESLALFSFNFGDFDIRILEKTIYLPIFNEVRLIPFFDNGVGDALSNVPILPQVGKLFRLRGMGLLVALRIEVVIYIEIVLIIGIRFQISPFNIFNEFLRDYPFAIGSIVISIRVVILIEIDFFISFVVALIKPGGQLKVLFYFNLSISLDFTISSDGRTLHFDPDFDMDVDYTRIGPQRNQLRPCGGRFQLADDNGQTSFTDPSGDEQSFYFVHSAGQCCVPWEFDVRLVRFRPSGGPRETRQGAFRADFCLNAAPSPDQLKVIVVSNLTPEGYPPALELDILDTAALRAMVRPVDEAGHEIPGAPLRDVRDFGYQVEFFLERTLDVVDPDALRQGTALAQVAGENTIQARLFKSHLVVIDPETGEELPSALWPGGILGFDILSFLARGLPPAVRYGTLPVVVSAPPGTINITLTLAYQDPTDATNLIPVTALERNEPFEPQRQYLLAAMLSLGTGVSRDQLLTFTVSNIAMAPPLVGIPLITFDRGRDGGTATSFFTGELAQRGKKGTINLNSANITKLVPVANLTITPNNHEEPLTGTITKFVPPGHAVANKDAKLSVKFSVTSNRSGTTIKLKKNVLDVIVSNPETFEEYLRVFQEVGDIMRTSNLENFEVSFDADLPAQEVNHVVDIGKLKTYLKKQGEDLWKAAVTEVQTKTTAPDDRPLYWVRLKCLAALRAYFKRKNLTLTQELINQFELPSRGLELDGSISFGTTAGRKAVFTGFDPFDLPEKSKQSNPSGLSALAFNNKDFGPPGALVHVRSVVIPVRYADFDRNLIETMANSILLNSIAMLMTCSDNSGRPFYDVERWAGKMRGTGITDNNAIFKGPPTRGGTIAPGGAAAGGPQFLESTLPYEFVIATPTDTLDGPLGSTPFVMDQSYQVVGGASFPSPQTSDNAEQKIAWCTKLIQQTPGGTALTGSGGNYLSNEIFYRVALAREDTRPTLPPGREIVPTGHFHVPSTDLDPAGTGPDLISGVTEALNRLLAAAILPRLKSVASLAFLNTVTTHSRSLTLTATNDRSETIIVTSAQVEPPFAVALPGPVPIPVDPGATLTLTLTFTPTDLGPFTRAVRLRNPDGRLVLACTLKGEGVQTIPAPQITRFDPTSGFSGEDTLTITGDNLDGTTTVRIGTLASPFTVVSDTQVTAEVTGPPRVVHITVETPFGTAVSSGFFSVRRRRIQPEDLRTQLLARRTELELNPQEAAAQLGVTPTTYNRWERGQDVPRTRYRPAIITFLGHDPGGEPETFGERIRAARELEGLSKPQLAQRLGISTSTIRAWEADHVSRPTSRVVNIFEDYLNEV